MGLTFYSLESIKDFGIPIVLDDIPLTFIQASVMVNIVNKLIDEAEYEKDAAIKKAVPIFMKMYVKKNNTWIAEKILKLTKHGNIKIKNKFYKIDDGYKMRNKNIDIERRFDQVLYSDETKIVLDKINKKLNIQIKIKDKQ